MTCIPNNVRTSLINGLGFTPKTAKGGTVITTKVNNHKWMIEQVDPNVQ